jgi:hypothetical protein
MGFSDKVKHEIFVLSARHCCACYEPKGLNIEVHHIIPRSQGGEDTLENAIALCFDCHADAGHYFAGHPKGSKLNPEELKKHKEKWFKIVSEHRINEPQNASVELFVANKDFQGSFEPTFVKEITTYLDRNMYKKMNELLGKNNDDFVKEFKEKIKTNTYFDHYLKKVNTYDELINYLNGDYFKQDDREIDTNCQPVRHQFGAFKEQKIINKSNCILNLKLTNIGPEVLEDYKLYLSFVNVVKVDSANKNMSAADLHRYHYNVSFFESNKGEFVPERNILVQNDSVMLDAICFRPEPKAKFVSLNWELFARNMYTYGNLKIEIKSKFEKSNRHKYVDNASDLKNETNILPKIEFG